MFDFNLESFFSSLLLLLLLCQMFTFNSFCLCCLNTRTEDVLQGFCFFFLCFFFMWCQNKHNMVLQYRKYKRKKKKEKRNWIFLIWKTDFSTHNLQQLKEMREKDNDAATNKSWYLLGSGFPSFFPFFVLYVSWLFAFLCFHKFFWFLTFLYCQEIEFFSFFLLSFVGCCCCLYDPLEQIYCYFIVLMTDLNSQSHCRFYRIYVDYVWPIPLVYMLYSMWEYIFMLLFCSI